MTDDARLLRLARETLKAEVLPHLPPDRLYPALMVLTALGLVSRRSAGGRDAATDGDALAAFVGAGDRKMAGAALARRLREEPDLAAPDLHAALLALTRARCALSNPKARALAGLPGEL